MHTELTVQLSTIYAFLLVCARMAGAFVFVPIPGFRNGPVAARVILAVSMSFALIARWPVIDADGVGTGRLVMWLLAETGFGLAVGLAVSFVLEGFSMAAQMLSSQAGFNYAATIDPNSNADSTVLIVTAQLAAGLLFFAAGLDRQVLQIFARSLETHPPGSLFLTQSFADELVGVSSTIFTMGLRLALPLGAFLLLIDVSLGLLGRLNGQLQLLSLALPLKLMASLGLLAWSMYLYPRMLVHPAEVVFGILRKFVH